MTIFAAWGRTHEARSGLACGPPAPALPAAAGVRKTRALESRQNLQKPRAKQAMVECTCQTKSSIKMSNNLRRPHTACSSKMQLILPAPPAGGMPSKSSLVTDRIAGFCPTIQICLKSVQLCGRADPDHNKTIQTSPERLKPLAQNNTLTMVRRKRNSPFAQDRQP